MKKSKIIVVVEDVNETEGILLDFVDNDGYRRFVNKSKKENEIASMILLKNYNKEVTLYAYYELTESFFSMVEQYYESYIVGFTVTYNDSIGEILKPTRYYQNKCYTYGKTTYSLPQKIQGNEMCVDVLNVGQANYNEIYEKGTIPVVYDMGYPIYASKKEVDAFVNKACGTYGNFSPMLVISHWDLDHYHCLKSLLYNSSICFPFSSVMFIGEQPNKTVKEIVRKIEQMKNVRTMPIAVQKSRKMPELEQCASISGKIRFYAPKTYQSSDRNTAEIVVIVENDFGSVLLSGDSQYSQISKLLKYIKTTTNHNLVVPHHGGDCGKFIYDSGNLSCEKAFISVGKNIYEHPNNKVMEDLKNKFWKVEDTKKEQIDLPINLNQKSSCSDSNGIPTNKRNLEVNKHKPLAKKTSRSTI